MKTIYLGFILLLSTSIYVHAQSVNDVLNVLIENKTISQAQADSIRAEDAIKQQDALLKKKSFPLQAAKALQLSGYSHIRFQWQDDKTKTSGFDIRRARLDLKGDIDPYWGYRVQYELAVAPKLLDAYVDFKYSEYLNVRLGQFNLPFSLENLTADPKLYSIDRSQVVDNLSNRKGDVVGDNNGRDIGLQISGNVLKINSTSIIDYSVGIFNGAGINQTADNYHFKDISGRLVFHIVKGIDLGISGYNGQYVPVPTTKVKKDAKKSSTKNEEADGLVITTVTDTATATTQTVTTTYPALTRKRIGADISVEFDGASLRAEYIEGTNGLTKSTNRKLNGYYVQLGYYVLPSKLQAIVKYDTFEPNTTATNDVLKKIIIGANYTISSNSRLQVAYNIQKLQGSTAALNVATVQFQIGF